MARQAVTLFSVDQNFHFQNAGNVGGECTNQRGDGKFLDQNAGTVSIGKGGIKIDDREAGINQVHAANLGANADGVRRRLVEIKRKQSTKQFFSALLAAGGQRDPGRLRTENAGIVIGYEKRQLLGGAGRGGSQRTSVRSGDGDGGASAFLRGPASFANVIPLPGTVTSDTVRPGNAAEVTP